MKLKYNLSLIIGAFLIFLLVGLTITSLFYTPHESTTMSIQLRLQSPNSTYLLGTDQFGRDLLSRIMVGGQTSLIIGFIAVFSGMVIGVFLGTLAGYYRKYWDEVLMRIADGLYSFPAFLLALLSVTLLGAGIKTVMVAIAVANIPIFMRITRANILSLSQLNYIEAAKAIGASDFQIIVKHILPNMLSPLLVQISVNFAAAVLAEASLSYLGVGTQPPLPSWGRMLREAQSFGSIAPWAVIFPGLAIAVAVLGFNLLGDGIQSKR